MSYSLIRYLDSGPDGWWRGDRGGRVQDERSSCSSRSLCFLSKDSCSTMTEATEREEVPLLSVNLTYGVWSSLAGGFISGDFTKEEAQEALQDHLDQGEDVDDLEVLAECPEHPDEPYVGCSECYTQEDEDGEEDDEDGS